LLNQFARLGKNFSEPIFAALTVASEGNLLAP
jgi:hypothetical protein